MQLFVISAFILVVNLAHLQVNAQGSTTDLCDALVRCLDEVGRQRDHCFQLQQQQTGKSSKSSTIAPNAMTECAPQNNAGVKSAQESIKSKRQQQSVMFKQCVDERKGQSFDVMTISQNHKARCTKFSNDYQNFNRTAGSADQSSDRRRPVKGKGQGRGGQQPRGRPVATLCNQKAARLNQICNHLSQCCSEAQICHLKVENSPLASEVKQLQLDLATVKHDCIKNKLST